MKSFHIFIVVIFAALTGATWLLLRPGSGDRPLVVYCSHEAAEADPILQEFSARTGIKISPLFESKEADSSDLAGQIVREKEARRCDVFWDGDPGGVLDLQAQGFLLPYQGPGFAHIPAGFKAPDGSWAGFAARVRVTIANTARIGTTPPNLDGLLPGSDRSKIATVRPLSGTALLHYAALWQVWGRERLIQWHRDWHASHVRECEGNAAVKEAVAEGICYAGYTDTDAYFEAKDTGKPVAAHPIRLENGRTLCIPNAVAILRGTRQPKNARRLVDFLLSEDVELRLAQTKRRLVPLGPITAGQLPEEVKDLVPWIREAADLSTLGPAQAECLAWLKSEYGQ